MRNVTIQMSRRERVRWFELHAVAALNLYGKPGWSTTVQEFSRYDRCTVLAPDCSQMVMFNGYEFSVVTQVRPADIDFIQGLVRVAKVLTETQFLRPGNLQTHYYLTEAGIG